jgi:hypothetical protein
MELRQAFGRNFNIPRTAQKRYEALRKEPLFDGLESKHIFMLAMTLAFRKKLERKKIDRYPLLNTTSFTDADLWGIAAIAFEETGNLMTLNDANEMKRIAEEYAMAGLPELERIVAECDSTDNLVLDLNKQGLDGLSLLKK